MLKYKKSIAILSIASAIMIGTISCTPNNNDVGYRNGETASDAWDSAMGIARTASTMKVTSALGNAKDSKEDLTTVQYDVDMKNNTMKSVTYIGSTGQSVTTINDGTDTYTRTTDPIVSYESDKEAKDTSEWEKLPNSVDSQNKAETILKTLPKNVDDYQYDGEEIVNNTVAVKFSNDKGVSFWINRESGELIKVKTNDSLKTFSWNSPVEGVEAPPENKTIDYIKINTSDK